MSDIVISEFIDADALALLEKDFAVNFAQELWQDSEGLCEALSEARALVVRNRTQVTADLLDHGSNLKVIGRLGVGLDNIDVAACQARNISVRPATGANTVSVAEYTIAAMLMLLRPAYFGSRDVIAGRWPRGRRRSRFSPRDSGSGRPRVGPRTRPPRRGGIGDLDRLRSGP